MRGGTWMAWIAIGASLVLFVTARLTDPQGWRETWARWRANARLALRMVYAGAVVVAWSTRPMLEGFAVRIQTEGGKELMELQSVRSPRGWSWRGGN